MPFRMGNTLTHLTKLSLASKRRMSLCRRPNQPLSHLDNSIASPICRVRTGAASNVFSVCIKKYCVRQLQLLLGPILGRAGGGNGSSGLGLWRCSDRARRGCAIALRAGACCVARTACLLRGRRRHITKAQPAGDTMRGIMMEDAKTDAAPARWRSDGAGTRWLSPRWMTELARYVRGGITASPDR